MGSAAFEKRHAAKEAAESVFAAAIAWCEASGKGGKACLTKNPQWAEVIKNGALRKRLKQKKDGAGHAHLARRAVSRRRAQGLQRVPPRQS